MISGLLLAVALADSGQTKAQALFKKVQGAVVTVETPESTGTGFYVMGGSRIVTCDHVIGGGAGKITIKGVGPATVVKRDATLDIAILKPSRPGKFSFQISSSPTPAPGAKVFMIGSTFGVLEKSFVEGMLSGTRHVGNVGYLQVSMPTNKGNSGAPIFDERGVVLGMAAKAPTSSGIGFAVSAYNLRSFLAAAPRKPQTQSPAKPKAKFDTSKEEYYLTVRPAMLYSSPDERGKHWSLFRKAEPLSLYPSKFPQWKIHKTFDDDILGYVRTADLVKVDAQTWDKAFDAFMDSQEIPEDVEKLLDELDEADLQDEMQLFAIEEKLFALGQRALRGMVAAVRTAYVGPGTFDSLSRVFMRFGEDGLAALADMNENGDEEERTGAALIIRSGVDHALESSVPGTDVRNRLLAPYVADRFVKPMLAWEKEEFDENRSYVLCRLQIPGARESALRWIKEDEFDALAAFGWVATEEDLPLLRSFIKRRLDEFDSEPEGEESTTGLFADASYKDIFNSLSCPGNTPCRTVLLEYINHDDAEYRAWSARAIGTFTNDEVAIKAIESILEDEDVFVRGEALYAASYAGSRRVAPYILKAFASEEASTRSAAILSMEYVRSEDCFKAMLKCVDDKVPGLRQQLVDVLEYWVDRLETRKALEILSKDSSPAVRRKAQELLKDLPEKSKPI